MSSAAPPPRVPSRPGRALLERAVHDLKNPLSVVRSSLEWLELELADRAEALDAVRDATAASERLVSIIDDLDALARLAEGAPVTGAPVEIVGLVTALVAAERAKCSAPAITVAVMTPDDGPVTRGDAQLLARAIGALVGATTRAAPRNSFVEVILSDRASPAPATEISIGLRGALDRGSANAELSALDTSGVGVYLAWRVLDAHGGTLEVIQTTSLPRFVVRLLR